MCSGKMSTRRMCVGHVAVNQNIHLFWGQLCHSLAVFSHSLLSSLAISLSLSLSSSVFSMCNAYTRWSAPHRFCWLFWLVNIDEPVLYYNLTSHNNIIVIVTHRISCVVLEDSTWLYFFALRYDNTSAQSRVRVKYTTTYTGRVFTCERQQMCSGLVSVVQPTAMTEDDEKHHSTATHTQATEPTKQMCLAVSFTKVTRTKQKVKHECGPHSLQLVVCSVYNSHTHAQQHE